MYERSFDCFSPYIAFCAILFIGVCVCLMSGAHSTSFLPIFFSLKTNEVRVVLRVPGGEKERSGFFRGQGATNLWSNEQEIHHIFVTFIGKFPSFEVACFIGCDRLGTTRRAIFSHYAQRDVKCARWMLLAFFHIRARNRCRFNAREFENCCMEPRSGAKLKALQCHWVVDVIAQS